MSENNLQIEILLALKRGLPTIAVAGATLFGAVAHAVEEVRKSGWRGWGAFLSDIFVCSFVGWVFFHVLTLTGQNEYAIIGSSIGSYWGTKGFVKIREIFFSSISQLKK